MADEPMPELVPVDGEWHYPVETPTVTTAVAPAQIEAQTVDIVDPLKGHMPVYHSRSEQGDLYRELIIARDAFLAAITDEEKARTQKLFDAASAKYNHAAYHHK